MKKNVSMLVAALMIFGFSGKAAAAGDSVSYASKAGIKPDSFLYSADKAMENLSLKFANTDEKKLKVLKGIAEERLGESEAMSEKDKTDLAKNAMLDFNDSMDKCSTELDKITDSVQASGDENKESDLDKLQEEVANTSADSVQVLEKIKDKLPDEDKNKAEWVIEMQQAKKEAVKTMVEKRHELNAARKTLNEAKAALEKAQKSGNEEEIAKAQEALATAQQTYDAKQQDFKQAFENKKAVIEQYKGKKNEAKSKTEDAAAGTVVNDSEKTGETTEKASLPKAENKTVAPAGNSSKSTGSSNSASSTKNKDSENKNIEQKKNSNDSANNEKGNNAADDAQSHNKKDKKQ